MAHFLEHLVFKGGEKYVTYRDVNQAAEGIGAVLNAYTSHDLVAFHITSRAERGLEAADLLTDFVGRPRIDPDELERERGVVVQEIARANDQPAVMAEHLIDEAVFGDHPLGRPVLGTEEHIRDGFTREGIVAFRDRRWSPADGGAFVVGNLDSLNGDGQLEELFDRFPARPEPQPFDPAPPLQPRAAGPRARLQPVAPADVLPAAGRGLRAPPIARRSRSTRPSWAGRWPPGCSTRSANSAGSRTPSTRSAHAYADVPVLQLSAGLDSTKTHRGLRADERRSSPSCASRVRPATRSSAPARTPPERGRSRSRTPAPWRATRAQQAIVYGEDVDPDRAIALLDEVPFDRVAEVAAAVSDELSVACVGPQTVEDFESG